MSSGPHNHNPTPGPAPSQGGGPLPQQPYTAAAWLPPGPPSQPNPLPAQQSQSPNNNYPPTVGYAVGSMLGHIWKAITSPVEQSPRQAQPPSQHASQQGTPSFTPEAATPPPPGVPLHRTVQEQETISPDGRVILRRTTIEEVEIRQALPEQGAGPGAAPPAPSVQ